MRTLRMHARVIIMLLMVLAATHLVGDYRPAASAQPDRLPPAQPGGFDPGLSIEGTLPPGALGLPGEPVVWVITVTNRGNLAGRDVLITGTLPVELRIESAETDRGDIAVSDQVGAFRIPLLAPGETMQMRINASVVRSPASGALVTQVVLAAIADTGEITRLATGELFVPTQLPATGYEPQTDMPGDGEPSVQLIALVMLSILVTGAAFVWYRGRSY